MLKIYWKQELVGDVLNTVSEIKFSNYSGTNV